MRSLDDLPGVAPGNLLVGLAEDSCTGAYYSRDDTKYRDPFQELHNKELCKPENSMALGTQRCAAGLCNLKTKLPVPQELLEALLSGDVVHGRHCPATSTGSTFATSGRRGVVDAENDTKKRKNKI